jgi:DNA-binding beta-propeller fold protein YncE
MLARAHLASSLVGLCISAGIARAEPPALRAVQVIPLPGVQKRIDHLAIDLRGQRLFVAALGNGTLEVVDLAAGKRLRSVPGLSEPQGVVYLPDLKRVIVANAGGTVVSFDDQTFQRAATLGDLDDADNVRVETATGQLYVGYGDGALAAIDPKTLRKLWDLKLPGHPESLRLQQAGPLVYVNVPRTKEIVVVDRKRRLIVSTIPVGALAENFPMALDESHHRLFVGTRRPPRLVVVDAQSHPMAEVPCVEDADDVFFDPDRDRVYVTGGGGFVDVFDARPEGHYERIAHVPTAVGARTSLWVPELRRLFVAAPARGLKDAALHVLEAPAVK